MPLGDDVDLHREDGHPGEQVDPGDQAEHEAEDPVASEAPFSAWVTK